MTNTSTGRTTPSQPELQRFGDPTLDRDVEALGRQLGVPVELPRPDRQPSVGARSFIRTDISELEMRMVQNLFQAGHLKVRR